MSEYAQRFAENGIDVSALRHLTDQDLKDIGVLLGHRGCDPVALKAASRCLRRIKVDAGPSRPSSRAVYDLVDDAIIGRLAADAMVAAGKGNDDGNAPFRHQDRGSSVD
jgi:hypothetical protein